MTDRETLPIDTQDVLHAPDRRLDAYYFGFDATGQPTIDAILSAVAHAGKAYHHTDTWADEGPGWGGGLSYVELIQAAAADAARERAALLDDLDRAEAEVKRLREGIGSLADEISEGTRNFMDGWEKAGQGISRRMSGETAAMVVQARAEMESYVRKLLDGGDDQ